MKEVAFAAIQRRNAKHEAERAAKGAVIAAPRREVAELRQAVETLLARTSGEEQVAQVRRAQPRFRAV